MSGIEAASKGSTPPVSTSRATATEIATVKATDRFSATVVTVADRRLCSDANAIATQLRDMETRWLNEDKQRDKKGGKGADHLRALAKADKKRTSDAAPLYSAAAEVRGRLLSRLHDEQPAFADESVPLFLSERGALRGAHPLMETAYYLEQLARKVCG
jgi:hypothetical protein